MTSRKWIRAFLMVLAAVLFSAAAYFFRILVDVLPKAIESYNPNVPDNLGLGILFVTVVLTLAFLVPAVLIVYFVLKKKDRN